MNDKTISIYDIVENLINNVKTELCNSYGYGTQVLEDIDSIIENINYTAVNDNERD